MSICLKLIGAALLLAGCQGTGECRTPALLQTGSLPVKPEGKQSDFQEQGQHEVLMLEDAAERSHVVSTAESHVVSTNYLIAWKAAIKSHYCGAMLAILVFMCCCGSALAAAFGKNTAGALNCCCTATVLIYMFHSGVFHQWWAGQDVGLFCRVLSLWAAVLLFFWGCCCCFLSFGVGSVFLIKNEVVRKMRVDFDTKEASLRGPRREYYRSAFFTEFCDALFDQADVDKSGEVDMNELRGIIKEATGSEQILQAAELFSEAFKDNGDSKVQRSEFKEMVRYFSVVRLEITDEAIKGVAQYYEILQLPVNSPKNEVEQAYLSMKFKWDPEKRKGVPEEEATKDLQEIEDAYERICKHLQVPEEQEDSKPSQRKGSCRTQ